MQQILSFQKRIVINSFNTARLSVRGHWKAALTSRVYIFLKKSFISDFKRRMEKNNRRQRKQNRRTTADNRLSTFDDGTILDPGNRNRLSTFNW